MSIRDSHSYGFYIECIHLQANVFHNVTNKEYTFIDDYIALNEHHKKYTVFPQA